MTAAGVLMRDGRRGDRVKVRNIDSGKISAGVLVAPNRVEISR